MACSMEHHEFAFQLCDNVQPSIGIKGNAICAWVGEAREGKLKKEKQNHLWPSLVVGILMGRKAKHLFIFKSNV